MRKPVKVDLTKLLPDGKPLPPADAEARQTEAEEPSARRQSCGARRLRNVASASGSADFLRKTIATTANGAAQERHDRAESGSSPAAAGTGSTLLSGGIATAQAPALVCYWDKLHVVRVQHGPAAGGHVWHWNKRPDFGRPDVTAGSSRDRPV